MDRSSLSESPSARRGPLWRLNDAIVWDNRRCMHAGMGNLPGEPRYDLRTVLAPAVTAGRWTIPSSAPLAKAATK